VSKGARFLGFLLSRFRSVLGGISSIPFDLASFGEPTIGYIWSSHEVFRHPQSLVRIRVANREIEIVIWES
jgi:hypothetical protein